MDDDITYRLQAAEGSGRVEFKRSVLWSLETEPLKIQGVLMRLANANVEVGGLVHLGRADDGTVVGMVNKDLVPVTDQKQIKGAEQKLMQVAQRLDPPMQLRWFEHEMDGLPTIVVAVPGRPTGGWYQDENGVAKTGSASHPVIARQAMLRSWAREGEVPTAPPYKLLVSAYARGLVTLSPLEENVALRVFTVGISNVGSAPSHVDHIGFQFIINGQPRTVSILNPFNDPILNRINPTLPFPVEPGRTASVSYRLSGLATGLQHYVATWLRLPAVDWESVALVKVVVADEITNTYECSIEDNLRAEITRSLVTAAKE